MAAHHRPVARNGPRFFRDPFRKAIPTSIDELEWGSPFITGMAERPIAPVVKAHSIIAVVPGAPPNDRTDGLVRYAGAHLGDAASEKVVAAGHRCQSHPEVIAEVRRILAGHTGS
jgi:hypothetical protein